MRSIKREEEEGRKKERFRREYWTKKGREGERQTYKKVHVCKYIYFRGGHHAVS